MNHSLCGKCTGYGDEVELTLNAYQCKIKNQHSIGWNGGRLSLRSICQCCWNNETTSSAYSHTDQSLIKASDNLSLPNLYAKGRTSMIIRAIKFLISCCKPA